MTDKEQELEHFHVDKRVSWGNLWTIGAMFIAGMFWFFQTRAATEVNANAIQRNAAAIQELRSDMRGDYKEILGELKDINRWNTQHLQQHIEDIKEQKNTSPERRQP